MSGSHGLGYVHAQHESENDSTWTHSMKELLLSSNKMVDVLAHSYRCIKRASRA